MCARVCGLAASPAAAGHRAAFGHAHLAKHEWGGCVPPARAHGFVRPTPHGATTAPTTAPQHPDTRHATKTFESSPHPTLHTTPPHTTSHHTTPLSLGRCRCWMPSAMCFWASLAPPAAASCTGWRCLTRTAPSPASSARPTCWCARAAARAARGQHGDKGGGAA